jgi:choice-of-anchor B domain-containing protein
MSNARLLATAALLLVAPLQAQQFGYQIAFDGDGLLITEPVDPNGTGPQGSHRTLYTYTRSGSEWVQSGTLQAPPHAGADYFGRSLALDGDRLYVGATSVDIDADGNSDGTVYVYRRDGSGWAFDSELRPESVPLGSSYGRFSSLSGDLFVVTALGYTAPGGPPSVGGAWVFERGADGGWVESGLLTPAQPDTLQEFFGWGAHTDGERVIIGAFAGQQLPGAAYVFGRDETGHWIQEARLALPEDEAQPFAAQGLGNAVGIQGDHALLGLAGLDNGAGAVLHFRRRASGDWERIGSLAAFDRQPGAQFGAAFAGSEGQLWIAAPGADGRGAIYTLAWDAETETFGSATKIRPGEGSDIGDGFGWAMAAGNGVAAVGQPLDDSGLGSVVLFRGGANGWEPTQKIFLPEERRELPALSDVSCSETGGADQFTCKQVDVLSFMPLDAIGGTDRGIQTNDVWGWTDPQTGREYALVGRTDGTAFVDVSSPASPIYLGNLAKTPGSRTNSWRDIKVYDDHAFVVADGAGPHGMQVFDLTRLRDVRNAPVEFEPDALYEGIASAHNIVINEASGTAYAVGSNSGGETCGGGLHMIDIRNPTDPQFLGCFQDMETGLARTGYSHDAMCIDYNGPDTEHAGREICFGSNENNLSIADVTDKANPVALSHAAYPNVAYAHQGWITEDHRYFFMNDEGDESVNQGQVAEGTAQLMPGTRTLIWDVSDLDDPVMVKEHFGETLTIDHNLYIKDGLMYQSNYVSGLRVLDISDPENPVEVGYFDTVPWDESVTFDGSWSNYPFFASGTIVVSSGKEGVFFLKHRRPELVP